MAGGEGENYHPEDEGSRSTRRAFIATSAAGGLTLAGWAAMKFFGDSAPEVPEGTKTVESIRRGVAEGSADARTAEATTSEVKEDTPKKAVEEKPTQSPAELAAEAKEVNPAKVAEIEAKIRAVKTYLAKFRPQRNKDGIHTPQTKATALDILAAARSTATARKDLDVHERQGDLIVFDKAQEGKYIGDLLFSIGYYGENRDRPTVRLFKGRGIKDEAARFDEKGTLAMHRQISDSGDKPQEFVFYDRGSYSIYHLKQGGEHGSQSTEYEILVDKKGKPFMAREIKDGIGYEVYFIDKAAREAYKRGDFNNPNWGPGKSTDHWKIAHDLWDAEFAADQKRRQEADHKVESEIREQTGVERVVNKGKVEQTEREILQHPTFLDKLQIEFNGDRLTAASKAQLKSVLSQALNCRPEQLDIEDNMPWVERKKEKYVDVMLKGQSAATVVFNKETGELEIEIGSYLTSAKNTYAERLRRDAAGALKSHVQERWQNGEIVQFRKDEKRLALRTFSGDRKRVVSGKEVHYENGKTTYILTKDSSGKMGFIVSDEKGPSIYVFNVLKGGFESPY